MEDQQERRASDGKIWSAIEELRRGQAVREEQLTTFISYQRERNHDILNQLNGTNGQLQLLREEMKAHRDEMHDHWIKQSEDNKSFFKKGLIFLGGVITALVAYIWQTAIGK